MLMGRKAKIDIPTLAEKLKEGYDNKELAFYFNCSIATVVRAKQSLNLARDIEHKNMMHCPYCNKPFRDWVSVRAHVSQCEYNTHDFVICKYYGPIPRTDLQKYRNIKDIEEDYPRITISPQVLRRYIRPTKEEN